MSDDIQWYRSTGSAPEVRASASRTLRNWLRARLPEPDVRGRTMVLHSRRTFPKVTRNGIRSDFHGLFSEVHSVLGALAYAEDHGAAGVRVDFRSPLYEERDRGPNWWTYYFESDVMRIHPRGPQRGTRVGVEPRGPQRGTRVGVELDVFATAPAVDLNAVLTKYGRFGGFSDIVGGPLAYLYPMMYGISRQALHRLLNAYIHVRPEILDEVQRFVTARFEPGAFIVGVHYRGTDSTHKWTGALNHYRMSPVPYQAYVDEVRRVLDMASPSAYQVFVATDEIDCLEFMERRFGGRLIALDNAPRVRPYQQAVHLDRTLTVSNYQKGKSALVDCLVLAAASYLVKGRSNLSDASLAFNPQLPYSFCPDVAALRRGS